MSLVVEMTHTVCAALNIVLEPRVNELHHWRGEEAGKDFPALSFSLLIGSLFSGVQNAKSASIIQEHAAVQWQLVHVKIKDELT